MGDTVAIIPARGGSKGIPGKNLLQLCGKPLIVWSIEQALASNSIDSVWVTSDSAEILEVATASGANPILRPPEISGDTASSESAWLHAIDVIEGKGFQVSRMIGMQATSPLRQPQDLDAALRQVDIDSLDSLLTVVEIEDFFIWKFDKESNPESVNYDFRHRRPRQQIEKRYLENGSFYITRPEILRLNMNRLGGRIGMFVMEKHKMFQIDTPSDVQLCAAIMRGYGFAR